MSRKPKDKPKLAPPSAPAAPGRNQLLQRLADQIARGFGAERMRREAAALIEQMKSSIEPETVRERLEEISEQLAEGVEAAEEQASEIDSGSKSAVAAYEGTLAALRATHAAFSRAAQSVPT
jgi:non-homologous end joining protein Ku